MNRAIAAADVRNRLDAIQTGLAETREELQSLRELCDVINKLLSPDDHDAESPEPF